MLPYDMRKGYEILRIMLVAVIIISTHNSISNPKLGCTLDQTNAAVPFYCFLPPLLGARLVLAVLVAALSLALRLADVRRRCRHGLRCRAAGAFVGAAHDS